MPHSVIPPDTHSAAASRIQPVSTASTSLECRRGAPARTGSLAPVSLGEAGPTRSRERGGVCDALSVAERLGGGTALELSDADRATSSDVPCQMDPDA